MNELAKIEVTPAQMDVARRTLAADATPEEFQLWMYDCQRQGVHPLDRMLHFTKRGGKYTPVAGIDLLRSRADETGEYVGNSDATFVASKEFPTSAAVTVRRLIQGTVCEFAATARWTEYYPGDASGHMWRKMPHVMLAKCAEALALRKAFPRALHGVYISEEMDQAGTPQPARTQPSRTPPAIRTKTVESKTVDAEDLSQPAGIDDGEKIAKVENIDVLGGAKKDGTPWTMFVITLDGNRYGTFSETLRDLAGKALDEDLKVAFTWKPGRKAGSRNLETLEIIGDAHG